MSYYKYNINKNDRRFQKLIENSKSTYQFYKIICEHLDAFVVSSKQYFIVEIDEEEHFHLVRDITNKLTTQIIKRKRLEKKMGHGYIIGNLLLLLRFLNKMKNQTKKIKLETEKKIDSLLKITFDFITRQCKRSYDEKTDRVLDIK